VVDTRNFHGRGWITTHAGSGPLRGVPQSEQLRLIERFTRIDADTIEYEVTADDPEVFERPWTVSMPLTRSDDHQLYEDACHEGNKATELILRGVRTLERERAATPTTGGAPASPSSSSDTGASSRTPGSPAESTR